jgi:hypothetical protein
MNKREKLLVGAIAGLVTVGMTAAPVFAKSSDSKSGTHMEKTVKSSFWSKLFGGDKAKDSCKGKDACSGKDGCKGKDGCPSKDKSKESCKGKDGCKSKDKAKDSCKSKDGCHGKDACSGKDGCGAKK